MMSDVLSRGVILSFLPRQRAHVKHCAEVQVSLLSFERRERGEEQMTILDEGLDLDHEGFYLLFDTEST